MKSDRQSPLNVISHPVKVVSVQCFVGEVRQTVAFDCNKSSSEGGVGAVVCG